VRRHMAFKTRSEQHRQQYGMTNVVTVLSWVCYRGLDLSRARLQPGLLMGTLTSPFTPGTRWRWAGV